MREMFNAVIYVVKSGCDGRMLLHDFPDWHILCTITLPGGRKTAHEKIFAMLFGERSERKLEKRNSPSQVLLIHSR